MQKMNMAELEWILHSLCSNLGIEAHSPDAKGKFLKWLNKHEDDGDVRIPSILRRLERTIAGICDKYSWLGLRENTESPHPNSTEVEREIEVLLKGIKMEILGLEWDSVHSGYSLMDSAERYLRIALSGRVQERGDTKKPGQLEIDAFFVSEKCKGGCSTCGISARAGGPQMPWELFEGAIESPDIFINPYQEVGLGDAEVLLYPRLFEAVERLVVDCGCKVGFTTAGLLPQNRETGREFFRKLRELGPRASDVWIILSFNLLFGFTRSRSREVVDRYVGCFEETLDAIAESGAMLDGIVLLQPGGDEKTVEAYERVRGRVNGMYGFNEATHIGIKDYITNQGDARESGLGTRDSLRSRCGCPIGPDAPCALRADGSLTAWCGMFGMRGSGVGSLAENNLEQVLEMLAKHRERFGKEIAPGGEGICQRHQSWIKSGRGVFRAPKSDNPVIKLKRAIGAGGMRQGGKVICRK
jgi:hypothetical protein